MSAGWPTICVTLGCVRRDGNAASARLHGGQTWLPHGSTRLSPSDLAGQNLIHLNIYNDGLIYTEGEYRSLLAGAGLIEIEIQARCLPGGSSLALGRKPA
jgi:hypothetical protein